LTDGAFIGHRLAKGRIVPMRRLVWVVAAIVLVAGAVYIALEGSRREAAVQAAVEAAQGGAEAEKDAAVTAAVTAAVDKAVAETEARLVAERPLLPTITVALDADEETRALFPDGAFLMEVGSDYRTAKCGDVRPNVHWVRLRESDAVRSEIERYEVNPLSVVVGVMTLGLTAFGGPAKPVQTIFAARTEGKYTTLILGALRNGSDPELVAPQTRLTLYRIDQSNFGVVERAPMDEPPAARPENAAPAFGQVLRRCAYQGGTVDL
jgi:hypothetical protein